MPPLSPFWGRETGTDVAHITLQRLNGEVKPASVTVLDRDLLFDPTSARVAGGRLVICQRRVDESKVSELQLVSPESGGKNQYSVQRAEQGRQFPAPVWDNEQGVRPKHDA